MGGCTENTGATMQCQAVHYHFGQPGSKRPPSSTRIGSKQNAGAVVAVSSVVILARADVHDIGVCGIERDGAVR